MRRLFNSYHRFRLTSHRKKQGMMVVMLNNTSPLSNSQGVQQSLVAIWTIGIIANVIRTEAALNGSSSVPPSTPNSSTRPGPTTVTMPLSKTPMSKKYNPYQNLPAMRNRNSLTRESAMAINSIVLVMPCLSPYHPQQKVPAMLAAEQTTRMQVRQWSSLMIGRNIILKFVSAYVVVRLFRSDPRKIRKKLRVNTSLSTLGGGEDMSSFSVTFQGSYRIREQDTSGRGCTCDTMRLPLTKQIPVMRDMMLLVLSTLFVTLSSKQRRCCCYTVACLFLGLTNITNRQFHRMPLSEKKNIRIEVTLCLCAGKCPHTMFSSGMALIENADPGSTTRKNASPTRESTKLSIRGDSRNMPAHILTTSSQPNLLLALVASRVRSEMGTMEANRMTELASLRTGLPFCTSQLRQQMLELPQMVMRPVASLMSTAPLRERQAKSL